MSQPLHLVSESEEYDAPPPAAPDGLGEAGTRLWDASVGARVFPAHEEAVLLQACRTADVLDRLAELAASEPVTVQAGRGRRVINPALAEQRQQSIVLARLLVSLRLPNADDDTLPQRRGGVRGTYGLRKEASK